MDLMLSLWWAALDLVRAQDVMNDVVAVGRQTQADTDRLRAANERWDAVREMAGR